jgi:hypothetical protein
VKLITNVKAKLNLVSYITGRTQNVFPNRVLRKIFGPRREEVKGSWRKLHNEELHKLHSSRNVIRVIKSKKIRWAKQVARITGDKCIKNLVGKPKGKRPFGQRRCTLEDNIIMFSSRLLSKKLKTITYKTIILPVVLYGCETWSLTIKEERRFKVFENRVLRRMFKPKRAEVAGGWRKLHNEELHKL